MTELKCTAVSCTYNEDHLCCKGDIMVEGADANKTEDTRCASFRERGTDSFRNSTLHPSKSAEVDCEVTKCVHNDDCKCAADSIAIEGDNACRCQETECSTFKCNC